MAEPLATHPTTPTVLRSAEQHGEAWWTRLSAYAILSRCTHSTLRRSTCSSWSQTPTCAKTRFTSGWKQLPRSARSSPRSLRPARLTWHPAQAAVRAALDLLDDPAEMYRQAGPTVRKLLNQAFLTHLYGDGPEVTEERLAEPYDEILYSATSGVRPMSASRNLGPTNGVAKDAARLMGTSTGLLPRPSQVKGSSKTVMVELKGLEPLTSSMPSTVGLCGGPALRLAIDHPCPPWTVTVRADW